MCLVLLLQVHYKAEEKGLLSAKMWYWEQVVLSLPGLIYNSIYWSVVMLRNYLLVAFRNLKKQKIYSLINISGLAVGMAGFSLFALNAAVKSSADRFHKNAERIYTIVQVISSESNEERHVGFTPEPFLPTLQNEFPEIEEGVRVFPAGKTTIRRKNDSF